MYQTKEEVFHHVSKHLKVGQQYSAALPNFNSLLAWNCDETLSVVFDVFLET